MPLESFSLIEEHPFLHFEVCFYHSIERCIRDGLSAFEPGHGGEQKLLRGFQPTSTYSAHYFRDPLLGLPIYNIGVVLTEVAAAATLYSMVAYLQAAWPELRR